jgi:hypothetical protein
MESVKVVLSGGFSSVDNANWVLKDDKLMIFFSSTFTDSSDERDFIMTILFPRLQIFARKYGVEIVFIDMR